MLKNQYPPTNLMPSILRLKPRRLTFIAGSMYVSLPPDWLSHHDLYNHRSVQLSIDDKSRLVIEPMEDYDHENDPTPA